MGILDDAIKEHLELKRQHGAAEAELKQLEDEAFGAAERPGDESSIPDPLSEAPTQFMSQPGLEQPRTPEGQGTPTTEPTAPETGEAPSRRSSRTEIADLQEPPPDAAADPPSTPKSEPPSGPTTEEREAIAEQPTEMFDVDEELASSQAEAPSEEELIEEEMDEPRLAPVDPLSSLDEEGEGGEESGEEGDDDFWDEKRLSDELNQALEAPSEVEDGDQEAEYEEEDEHDEEEGEARPPARHDEDVLEETPDFLEEAPEDDQLWFEQKPPKDFDFDD